MDIVSLLNTTGAIYGAGTTYHSGAPPVFSGVRVARCVGLDDLLSVKLVQGKFEGIKGVTRTRKSKDRQYNGHRKSIKQ
jgi:hypothetical protein